MPAPKKIYGLVGYPLGHSFSRKFFTEKFEAEHINAEYRNFEFSDLWEFAPLIGLNDSLCGFNVTIPYKEKIMAFLKSISPEAREIGAVNTVKISHTTSGEIYLSGYNTDIVGFTESIRPHLKGGNHSKALVLGTGGASKAIVAGLRKLSIEPTLVSRTPAEGRLTYSDLTPEVMTSHTVIVNTTPLGMWPNVDSCPPIPYELLTSAHVCFDAVYNPDPTLFMSLAEKQGATAIGGLEMLHIQALTAWQIWND